MTDYDLWILKWYYNPNAKGSKFKMIWIGTLWVIQISEYRKDIICLKIHIDIDIQNCWVKVHGRDIS